MKGFSTYFIYYAFTQIIMSKYHLLYLEKNMYKTINIIDLQINLRQGFQIKLFKLLPVVALELVLYTLLVDILSYLRNYVK